MDLLDRLFFRLRDVLSREHSDDDPELTVTDLYQRLIPYRAVRTELGVHELAQYEHALLRLLAGERGYVELAAAEAVLDLQRELASTNPILGIYRDYGGVPVRVRAASAPAAPVPETDHAVDAAHDSKPADAAAAAPEHDGRAAVAGDEAADAVARPGTTPEAVPEPGPREPAAGAAVPARPRFESPRPGAEASPRPPLASGARSAAGECARCAFPLPDDPGLRYCPDCGADQRKAVCGRCSAVVRPGWNFCIRCGEARPQR